MQCPLGERSTSAPKYRISLDVKPPFVSMFYNMGPHMYTYIVCGGKKLILVTISKITMDAATLATIPSSKINIMAVLDHELDHQVSCLHQYESSDAPTHSPCKQCHGTTQSVRA